GRVGALVIADTVTQWSDDEAAWALKQVERPGPEFANPSAAGARYRLSPPETKAPGDWIRHLGEAAVVERKPGVWQYAVDRRVAATGGQRVMRLTLAVAARMLATFRTGDQHGFSIDDDARSEPARRILRGAGPPLAGAAVDGAPHAAAAGARHAGGAPSLALGRHPRAAAGGGPARADGAGRAAGAGASQPGSRRRLRGDGHALRGHAD